MRSFVRGVGFFSAVVTVGFALGAQAQDQFQQIQGDSVSLSVPPLGHRAPGYKYRTVVVLFSGDSIADVQKRWGRKLSQSERDWIRGQRAQQHAAMKPEIERRGGSVLATYYGALNGIKVSIPESRLPELRSMRGVVGVKRVGIYDRANATSVPLIGAPLVWQGSAHWQGQGIDIAIIDTGIDYTHANFGGPGTVAA
ncbi:MAG TPA: hypothetical protein VL403_07530, partial [Candidatus Kryptonia bacterium]|nr:hypothetical protein [Candidatus Kryptonia bacterium]